MLPAEFPLYFCGLPFRAHQVRKKLGWLLGAGEIRQVLSDVYVDVRVPDTVDLRAAAVALLLPPDGIACGRTAAWVHGIETTALHAKGEVGVQWTREATDVVQVGELKVTSPIATTVELAMQLPRPFALSAVDAMLRSGIADRWAVRAASAAYEGRPGIIQARQILRYADRRAASPGESWLRLRLIDADFGQPDLQVRVRGPHRDYLIDLGYPDPLDDGRRLGLEYDSDRWHSRPHQEVRDEARRTELEALGWHIISVRRPDLWGSYPALELAVGSFLCRQPRLPRRW
ncbi:hypothetical protein EV138_5912 [Kribbella voronezhensis]|uniref:Transcriptional regulator, AbiEi antitoxin, Type IV TA system n=1 Tax=Kribbella voronezhensis TaxID=2512212 RepID=A0A4R7SYB0_9ACTN|nr:hypothetical protein [Kribbella voronezhensis]TDU83448.1 hypothetical protein EV138_5912 [Kribbella voronezhensis]